MKGREVAQRQRTGHHPVHDCVWTFVPGRSQGYPDAYDYMTALHPFFTHHALKHAGGPSAEHCKGICPGSRTKMDQNGPRRKLDQNGPTTDDPDNFGT